MVSSDSGSEISSREIHVENELSPISVRLSGNLIPSSLKQFAKAHSPIAVTGQPSIVSGITTSPLMDLSQSVIVTSPSLIS